VAALELLQWKEDVRDSVTLLEPLGGLVAALLAEEEAAQRRAGSPQDLVDKVAEPSRCVICQHVEGSDIAEICQKHP
jgi:hypothetical protein